MKGNMPRQKIINILLIAGLLGCIVQVWLPRYYLTGDGPCLMYNARMLSDFWRGNNISLYSRFYALAYQPNPNWVSHIILGGLMYVFDGATAEKVFLTVYVLLFVFGFYNLLRKINDKVPGWLLVILLFVFHHTLAKGFYNFSLSIAFYLWMVWSWLRYIDKKSSLNAVLFFLFSGLAFFTHLLPFVTGTVTCVLLAGSYALTRGYSFKQSPSVFFVKTVASLSLMLGPFVWLSGWFTKKEGGLRLHLSLYRGRLMDHVKFSYLVNFTTGEAFFAGIAGITLCTLMAVGIWSRLRQGFKWHKYDGFFVSMLFVFTVYMTFPEEFMGRAILITMRTQLFVYILMVCCIAYMAPPAIKNAGGYILFLCFGGLWIVRIPKVLTASAAVEDVTSANRSIRPGSVVLPLDFSPGGKDEKGELIGNANWLFTHVADYIGTGKPLIILDNYEANVGYFPFTWKEGKSPYTFLSREEGIEAQPPCADIDAYYKTSGERIDYIVMWCYDTSFDRQGHYSQLAEQVMREYHKVYSSRSGRTILYEVNNGSMP